MQLRKETNLYDDNAIADSIADVESKVVNRYGTCSTAAGTAAKVVSLSGFQLFTGARITVRFTNKNTAASPTLNVNSTGAKPIWAKSTTVAEQYYWDDSSEVEFTYDGTHWILLNAKTQTETFLELTSNGAIHGIFMRNDQMYINMDYLQTGTLKIGGASNGNGVMEVYNSSGTRTGRFDNTALYIGNIASNLTSPNTKITNEGAITTNSLTANDYIYVNGTIGSYFKIPINRNYPSTDYIEMSADNDDPLVISKHINSSSVIRLEGSAGAGWTATSNSNQTANYSYGGAIIHTLNSSNTGYYLSLRPQNASAFKIEYWTNGNPGTRAYVGGDAIYTQGTINCAGTKSRVVGAGAYGTRLLYCYETPSPVFGDIGEGTIAHDGKCYVFVDSIFAQTVSLEQYQVFLQIYGDGEAYVSERNPSYFVVEGTPNISFGWELKAKQSDFDQLRFDRFDDTRPETTEIDYGTEALGHLRELYEGRTSA